MNDPRNRARSEPLRRGPDSQQFGPRVSRSGEIRGGGGALPTRVDKRSRASADRWARITSWMRHRRETEVVGATTRRVAGIFAALHMSAYGTKRTCVPRRFTSAFG